MFLTLSAILRKQNTACLGFGFFFLLLPWFQVSSNIVRFLLESCQSSEVNNCHILFHVKTW